MNKYRQKHMKGVPIAALVMLFTCINTKKQISQYNHRGILYYINLVHMLGGIYIMRSLYNKIKNDKERKFHI